MSDPNKFDEIFKMPKEQIDELKKQKRQMGLAKQLLSIAEELGYPAPELKAELETAASKTDTIIKRFNIPIPKEK